MNRRIALVALAAAATLTAVGPADAARGGKKAERAGGSSTSTITIDQPGPYLHGQAITVSVKTSDTDRPFSTVTCSQNGTHVYQSTRGHFQDYYDYFGDPVHYLSSMAWPAGNADCTASLEYQARNGRMRTVAAVTFTVNG